MIHHLRGRLIEKEQAHIIVECGGVGYFVHISLQSFEQIGTDENIFIYTEHVVKEDNEQLFGFVEKQERTLFRHLVSVSGVGANTARVILSAISPKELAESIVSEDVNQLKKVKGIGLKTAQRIILDLKDKLAKEGIESVKTLKSDNTSKLEALSALVALGFDKKSAEKALERISADDNSLSVEQLIKTSLKML